MDEIEPRVQDLAMIGDRRSCAFLDKGGNIVWYCPKRFDEPSVFASLLDAKQGGEWHLEMEGMHFEKRAYVEDSAILQTTFRGEKGSCVLEDWMPLYASFFGICRKLTKAPSSYTFKLSPRPNYNRRQAVLKLKQAQHATIDFDFHLYASHPLQIEEETISCHVPAGEEAWLIFSETELDDPLKRLEESRKLTLKNWGEVAGHITYKGPYEDEVRKSLRLLRMLTYAQNGGLIAAATTSLPEVLGGNRNYDYRYVWLRDAAMIVSALARAGSDGEEERLFLSFICSAMHRLSEPIVPMFTLDYQPAGTEQELDFSGYRCSKPVIYGNGANHQLQLDANSNVLIAAKVIYNRYDTKEHWETVQRIANFIVDHWDKPDHGMWEETCRHHYTSSKVVASISLKYIAEHSDDKEEQERWLNASEQIKAFVHKNCLTSDGAYAVYAGSEDVDVSAVLFPIWGYTDADTPIMLKTIEKLEKNYCQNKLYRRHLVEYDSQKEGAFLAGTCWVAQYWVMRKNRKKVEETLQAVLRYMNDTGLMPEEGDPETGEWLGNIPQAFVHASLIGVVIDYRSMFEEK
ncbi:glycoside hydrolase family 15 protein [Pontibacter locisalis]|uniref:Glycoside hydrolase family 15 protein n=1 Tax=Pontibacter locisalis TaxID=1719035 RepID=A0ABW5IM74_9BACT